MSYNTAEVWPLNSFDEAKRWFGKVKPIRGQDIRPLGSRRYYKRASIAMPNENTVTLNYYDHPVVTWTPGGFSVTAPWYISAYSVGDISPFLPRGMRFQWIDCQLYLEHGENKWRMSKDDTLSFAVEGDARYRCLNEKQMFHVRKKRGALEAKMEAYAGFTSWLTVVMSVPYYVESDDQEYAVRRLVAKSGLPSADGLRNRASDLQLAGKDASKYWDQIRALDNLPYSNWSTKANKHNGFVRPAVEQLLSMARSEEPDEWKDVVNALAKQSGVFVGYTTAGSRAYRHRVQRDKLIAMFSDLVAFKHRDEVFELVPAHRGEIVHRTNQKYFNEFVFEPLE